MLLLSPWYVGQHSGCVCNDEKVCERFSGYRFMGLAWVLPPTKSDVTH